MNVMEQLREVLTEHRELKSNRLKVADAWGRDDAVSVRKFEEGKTAPRYREIDGLVAAYAKVTGVSVFDLWDEAINRARIAEQELRKLAEIEDAAKDLAEKDRATRERLSQGARRKPKPAPRRQAPKSRR